jgi:hypothetical protein
MPAIVSFPDWAEATGPLLLTGPDKYVNAAGLQNYSWAYFMKGKPLSETVQGGSEIRDDLMFDEANTFGFYQPNDPQAPTMPQVLTRWSGPWRFAVDSYSWTEEEETLNAGSQFTDDARFQQYKNLLTKLELRVQTSIVNGMEAAWWALPDASAMETTTGKKPYSIPAFINEQTNTLFGSQVTDGVVTAFTTVEGIDPTAAGKLKWRNQIIGYDSTAVKPTSGARNVINAFDDAYLSLRYRPPATKEAYFEGDTWNQLVCFTEKKGMLVMTDLLRQGQDWYTNRNNPDSAFLGPAYAGVELVYVPQLDAAKLYLGASSTSNVTSGDSTGIGRGPRFYLVNAAYLKTVFHSDKYFVRKPPMSPFNQPFSKTVWINVYFNNICRGRQFNAIITPGTVAGAFPSQTLTQSQVYAAY